MNNYNRAARDWNSVETDSTRWATDKDIFPRFDLRWYQRKIFAYIDAYPRVVIVAARQLGKSETILRYALSTALSIDNVLIVIASGGRRQASEILRRIKQLIEGCPYKIKTRTYNTTEIELYNKSRIISLPNNPRTVRGYPAHYLFIDEVDSIWDWEEFQSSVFPSIDAVDGTIVCSGTFKGKGALYKLFQGENSIGIIDPKYKWPSILLPYHVNPPINIEQQRHDLPPSIFAQEYECIPIDESGTLFPFALFDACRPGRNYNIDLESQYRPAGALELGGWDIAQFRDHSPIVGLEVLNDDPVATLRLIKNLALADNGGHSRYSEQVEIIKNIDSYLNFARIHADRTGVGIGPVQLLQDAIGESRVHGINFSAANKVDIANNFRIAIQDRQIRIPYYTTDKRIALLRKEAHDLDPKKMDHPPGGSSDYFWSAALAWDCYESVMKRTILQGGTRLSTLFK